MEDYCNSDTSLINGMLRYDENTDPLSGIFSHGIEILYIMRNLY